MGQVNVNTPNGGEPAGSAGAGMILGIIIAILVIAALVYFLLLAPGGDPGDNPGNGGNGGTDNGDLIEPTDGDGDMPEPTGWRVVELA